MDSDSNPWCGYASRRDRLIQGLGGSAILLTHRVNVRYLTGFTGSNAMLLLGDSVQLLLTDGRYVAQAATECPDLETRIRPVDSTMLDLVVDLIRETGVVELSIESESMSRLMWRELSQLLGKDVQLLDSCGAVEQHRALKDEHEISLIRRSVEINEAAMRATLKAFDSAWTELDFAWHLEHEIRQRGGRGFSFDPIVAAGPASALPHYRPQSVRIAEQDFLLVDWGTSWSDYASDLTRVIAVRAVPDKILEIHSLVADAKQAATEKVREGASIREVDSAARDLIAGAGYGEHFGHGLGHGIGLQVHEAPLLSPRHDGELTAGMLITIEPGIYLEGIGGVRLEDNVLVTAQGCERLNSLGDDFLTL